MLGIGLRYTATVQGFSGPSPWTNPEATMTLLVIL